MKIIAFYLPQFHNIPENDEWWGDGFTEWVNVKKAKPLYHGHAQPRVPLNNNYYDLLDDDVKVWQAKLAKKYGIYGFAYYHYWFSGHMLLEKPMEQMLANKNIDLPFCISWANETWTKAWVGDEKKVLLLQKYGARKEWKEHFDYLLKFFKDERYIKVNGCPFFIIYRPEVIPCLNEMLDAWNEWAKENGFPGMCFAYQSNDFDLIKGRDNSRFDYDIEFQPGFATGQVKKQNFKTLRSIRRNVAHFVEKYFGLDLYRFGKNVINKVVDNQRFDYDMVWENIIKTKPASNKNLPGAFVGWDNSPRHGERATIYTGDSPEKFEKYMTQQIRNARDNYHSDMLFMYAWNEWAEGGYLEPDTRNEYGNLEAIKNALEKNNEFPIYS